MNDETEHEIEGLMHHLVETLEEARKYGLECEVLAWAFMDLCKDHKRIKEAIDHGFYEWVK